MKTSKFTLMLLAVITICSCIKDDNNKNSIINYSGDYHGQVTQKVSTTNQTFTQPFEMILSISKGDNNQEIKILFGDWLINATLNSHKFTIQPVIFPGDGISSTGSGAFKGNKLDITYTRPRLGTSTDQYNGTITKL